MVRIILWDAHMLSHGILAFRRMITLRNTAFPNTMSKSEAIAKARKIEDKLKYRLGDDFLGLRSFFLEAFFRCATPVNEKESLILLVFVTRRCHALAQEFLSLFLLYADIPNKQRPECYQQYDLKKLEFVANRYFITDFALISIGEEIGKYYLSKRVMPKIILCDELLIHGRALNSIFCKLEEQVIRGLDDFQEGGEALRASILAQLVDNTELFIYAQNKQTLLLYPRYHRKLRSYKICEKTEWRALSKKLSIAVAEANTCNAAYSWCVRVPRKSPQYSRLKKAILDQPDERITATSACIIPDAHFRQVNYLYFYPDINSPKIIGTVRVKENDTTNDLMVVSFPLIGDISHKTQCDLYRSLRETLCDNNRSLFWEQNDSFGYPKRQSISSSNRLSEINSLLLGMLLLSRWMESVSPLSDNCSGFVPDVRHMGANFTSFGNIVDRNSEIAKNEIQKLFCAGISKSAAKGVFSILDNVAPIWDEEFYRNPNANYDLNRDRDSLNLIDRIIEDCVSSMGISAETRAYRALKSKIYSAEDPSFEKEGMSITDFLQEIISSMPQKSISVVAYIVAVVTQMMDLGSIGMVPAYDADNDVSYINVRAGEQALFIKPARYEEYLLALRAITSICKNNHIDEKLEIERFVKGVFLNHEDESSVDAECLSDELNMFVSEIQESGQDLREWDFPLVDCVNRINQRRGTTEDALEMIDKQYRLLSLYRQL